MESSNHKYDLEHTEIRNREILKAQLKSGMASLAALIFLFLFILGGAKAFLAQQLFI